MLQDATPDLTKYVPWWTSHVILILGGLWYVSERLYNVIKRGRKGQQDDRQGEIAQAVEKYKMAASEWEAVAKSRKERADELERELQHSEAEVARLRSDAETKRKITDRLQEEVFELQGHVDRLERRLPPKGGKDGG